MRECVRFRGLGDSEFLGSKVAAVVWDVGSGWLCAQPRCTRSAAENKKTLQRFNGDKPFASFYCYGAT